MQINLRVSVGFIYSLINYRNCWTVGLSRQMQWQWIAWHPWSRWEVSGIHDSFSQYEIQNLRSMTCCHRPLLIIYQRTTFTMFFPYQIAWDFIYAEYAMDAGHHHRSIVWQVLFFFKQYFNQYLSILKWFSLS